MSEDKKFTGFTKDHVGCDVTVVKIMKGTIDEVTNDGRYPIVVTTNGPDMSFGANGQFYVDDKNETRALYFGHNIKVEVTGEEIPEPKLICPVCGVEHGFKTIRHNYCAFTELKFGCPMIHAKFECEDQAIEAMKQLIKAMEGE